MTKILLIEDDHFIHDLYQRTLDKAGYEVVSAYNGEKGVELAKTKGVALILLDILMPKLNGIEVLKKLKADEILREIPVILLTNLGQKTIIQEAFKMGAQGYLLKARLLPSEIAEHIKEFFETGAIRSAGMQEFGLI